MFNQAVGPSFNQDIECATPEDEAMTSLISTKRQWGMLLGLSKKAIEVCIATGTADALQTVLLGFIPHMQAQLAALPRFDDTRTLETSEGNLTNEV